MREIEQIHTLFSCQSAGIPTHFCPVQLYRVAWGRG